ncbi:MAG: hypothetical protein ACWA5W_09805 [Phycisphaerales bacterium]
MPLLTIYAISFDDGGRLLIGTGVPFSFQSRLGDIITTLRGIMPTSSDHLDSQANPQHFDEVVSNAIDFLDRSVEEMLNGNLKKKQLKTFRT